MSDELETKFRIRNQLVFTYAREILCICRMINAERCIGCQYNISTTIVLTTTDDEVLMFHFAEAFQNIDHSEISNLFTKNTANLDIPSEKVKEFSELFNWNWWFENNQNKQLLECMIREAADILTNYQ